MYKESGAQEWLEGELNLNSTPRAAAHAEVLLQAWPSIPRLSRRVQLLGVDQAEGKLPQPAEHAAHLAVGALLPCLVLSLLLGGVFWVVVHFVALLPHPTADNAQTRG
jgi:hypothetical protein